MDNRELEMSAMCMFVGGLSALPLTIFFPRYWRLSRWRGLALTLVLSVTAGAVYASQLHLTPSSHSPSLEQVIHAVLAALSVLLGAAFVIGLYRRWVGDQMSDAERAGGAAGVRAWLGAGHVVCGLGSAVAIGLAWDYPIWTLVLLSAALLMAYPAIQRLRSSEPGQPTARTPESLGAERQRVLQLLEQGRISAEECTELLNALSETLAPIRPVAIGGAQGLRLCAAALLVVGFLLPWFAVNPDAEMKRAQGQMREMMGSVNGGGSASMEMPTIAMGTGTIYAAGYELDRGLGWIILVLGLGAAAVAMSGRFEPRTERFTVLGLLGAGGLILLVICTRDVRHLSVGPLVMLIGYGILAAATLRQMASAAPARMEVLGT